MKKMLFIISVPGDSDPLMQRKEEPIPTEALATVGWKLLDDTEMWHGNYIALKKPTNEEEIRQALDIMVNQAFRTCRFLEGEEE